jgi:hypothetical protein
MRRAAASILVLLLLGASVNVLVAWGAVLWTKPVDDAFILSTAFSTHPAIMRPATAAERTKLIDRVLNRQPKAPDISGNVERGGVSWCMTDVEGFRDVPRGGRTQSWIDYPIVRVSAGWPFRSLDHWRMRHQNASFRQFDSNEGIRIHSTSGASWWLRQRRTWLPLHPIWPGFLAGTTFYAAIFWTGSLATNRMRRRRRKGCCAACGYDQRGRSPNANVCPECGTATSPWSGTTVDVREERQGPPSGPYG